MNLYQYPSKILLFGEYSVIAGSEALALPVFNYGASWQKSLVNNTGKDQLKQFAQYLNDPENGFDSFIDIEKLNTQLQEGLYLKSDIPQGYGLGSSGSVCAAVLHRFAKIHPADISTKELQYLFAKMESYFHGTSSGIDPLVAYLQKPILVNADKSLSFPNLPPHTKHSLPEIFLYDSGIARKTEALVKLFRKKLENTAFHTAVYSQLVPIVSELIHNWANGNENVFEHIKKISAWQLENMPEFIPNQVLGVWQKYAQSQSIQFKLCGAGGGGFFLVFKQRHLNLPESLKDKLIALDV